MSDLASRPCPACTAETPRLHGEAITALHDQLEDGWEVVDEHHLVKSYDFPDFKQGLDFVDRVGAIAEEAWHHPDIELSWGKVTMTLTTHVIGGLSEADFVVAARIDRAYPVE